MSSLHGGRGHGAPQGVLRRLLAHVHRVRRVLALNDANAGATVERVPEMLVVGSWAAIQY